MKNITLYTVIFVLFITITASNCNENKTSEKKIIELSGKFESKKGVMNQISCYCFNGGYLKTEDGNKIPVCLPEKDEFKIKCEKVKLKGYYKTVKYEGSSSNPCPDGEMKIFFAESFKCE